MLIQVKKCCEVQSLLYMSTCLQSTKFGFPDFYVKKNPNILWYYHRTPLYRDVLWLCIVIYRIVPCVSQYVSYRQVLADSHP